MTIEEIRKNLETAFHETGHAFAYVGEGRFLAASIAVGEAREALQRAHDALDEIQG